jgi:hypothetical protein
VGPAAERLRAEVLDSLPSSHGASRQEPRWFRRRFILITPAVLAAGALAGFLLVTRKPMDGGLRSKGSGAAVGGVVELTCSGGTPLACPRGSRVSIALWGGGSSFLHVSAFAQPEGGGERIWYFSDEDGAATFGSAQNGVQIASRSAVIGPEHAPGRYVVSIVLSSRPLRRSDVLGPPPGSLRFSRPLRIVVP